MVVDHRQLFKGAGYYRVRINKVIYYLATTKETRKTHDDQKSNLLRGIARKPCGLRVTGRRRQRLMLPLLLFQWRRTSENLDRFPVAADDSSPNVRPIIPS